MTWAQTVQDAAPGSLEKEHIWHEAGGFDGDAGVGIGGVSAGWVGCGGWSGEGLGLEEAEAGLGFVVVGIVVGDVGGGSFGVESGFLRAGGAVVVVGAVRGLAMWSVS